MQSKKYILNRYTLDEDVYIEDKKNKTIEDVADENSCRYPLGEFNDPPKYFCGGIRYSNSPYCKVHLDVCTNKEKT
jgi:hypothetical protein